MTNIEIMQKILQNMRVKLSTINEMWEYTKIMEDSLNKNNVEKFAEFIEKRQQLMNKADTMDEQNKAFLANLPQISKDKISKILFNKSSGVTLDNQLETDIFGTQEKINMMFKRLVAYNQSVEKLLKSKSN